jgi:hypothetical protein
MSDTIEHIVIVGGGSAGWLVAGVLAAEHRLRVTLIESPDVPPIGVGEGTWPSMRDTLHRMGVSEPAFIRACDVSFKQGSRFDGWVTGAPGDHYYHPFSLPEGWYDANLAAAWQAAHRGVPFAGLVSFQPHLCAHGRAPKQFATPDFAAVANYGYHLDAGKFGLFLRDHCVGKLGVRHVLDHVDAVRSHENGDVAALATRNSGLLEGDLFIDCTGLQSLLLGKHYGVPFVSKRQVLFNDRALAVQLPYASEDAPIGPQTSATAQGAGWIWDIGLPARRGVGHVYSSAHTSDEEAEQALRAYVAATAGPEELPSPRKLNFEPGYRERFWHRNVLAIGLSSGFVEPLEASSLALVEMSAAWLADDMPVTRAQVDLAASRFNEAFTYRWECVIDFLKLHYVLSKRSDSAFWIEHRAAGSIPDRLREHLGLWRTRPPSRRDFSRIEEAFPTASWQYVLYGMGFRTEQAPRASDRPELADAAFRDTARLTAKMLPALPSNRELIDHILKTR